MSSSNHPPTPNPSGDQAGEFVRRLSPSLLQLIRRKMGRELRAKYDSQDFLQMVWKSFFRSAGTRLDPAHGDPAELEPYLKRIAQHKVADESRRGRTLKQDVRREEPLQDEPGGPQATPSQIVIAKEAWQNLVGAASPRDLQILQLRASGETQQAISERLGVDVRTVRRVMRLMEEKSQEARGGRGDSQETRADGVEETA